MYLALVVCSVVAQLLILKFTPIWVSVVSLCWQGIAVLVIAVVLKELKKIREQQILIIQNQGVVNENLAVATERIIDGIKHNKVRS